MSVFSRPVQRSAYLLILCGDSLPVARRLHTCFSRPVQHGAYLLIFCCDVRSRSRTTCCATIAACLNWDPRDLFIPVLSTRCIPPYRFVPISAPEHPLLAALHNAVFPEIHFLLASLSCSRNSRTKPLCLFSAAICSAILPELSVTPMQLSFRVTVGRNSANSSLLLHIVR